MVVLDGEYLTFDDVLLVPQYSDIESRSKINISTNIVGINLQVPVISSPMDSITEADMCKAMFEAGGLGILHRYMTNDKLFNQVEILREKNIPVIPSVGVNNLEKDKAKILFKIFGVDTINLDVAHAHSKYSIDMVKFLKDIGFKVIAGSISTLQGAKALVEVGVDTIRCGIGTGSICTTRLITGHSIPLFSSLLEVKKVKEEGYKVQIIADGGIKNSGDCVKALGAGADCCMIGRLLSGCKETPGEIIEGKKVYRGMASYSSQMEFYNKVHNDAPEGNSCFVGVKGSVSEVMKILSGGIRSGLAYSGCNNLKEFRENSMFIRVK